jgi:hypothetical protein
MKKFVFAALLGIFLFTNPTNGYANTLTVKTAAELKKALSSVKAGQTILLDGKNFGPLSLRNYNFTQPITLQGVTRDGQVPVIENLNVRDSAGLTFRNIKFQRDVGKVWETLAFVVSSQNIIFDRAVFSGVVSVHEGGEGIGLRVHNASNVSVLNSTFRNLYIGSTYGTSSAISVTRNNFSHIRKDGLNFSDGIQNLSVSQNVMSNFVPNWEAGDHPDHIQFWSKSDDGVSRNISVTDNILLVVPAQGIFMRADYDNPKGTKRFINVTISGNYYAGGMRNAITSNHAQNIRITDNIAVGLGLREMAPGLRALSSRISVSDSDGVTVTGNTTNLMNMERDNLRNTNAVYKNNTIVKYGIVPPIPTRIAGILPKP